MTDLRPIETQYNGYRFRSRLEARYAFLFDSVGVPYDYEREGFDLDGLYYLPDFWLPTRQLWVEIKGQTPNDGEREKARRLCAASRWNVLILAAEIGKTIESGRTPHALYEFGDPVVESAAAHVSVVFEVLGLDRRRIREYASIMRGARFETDTPVRIAYSAVERRRLMQQIINPRDPQIQAAQIIAYFVQVYDWQSIYGSVDTYLEALRAIAAVMELGLTGESEDERRAQFNNRFIRAGLQSAAFILDKKHGIPNERGVYSVKLTAAEGVCP